MNNPYAKPDYLAQIIPTSDWMLLSREDGGLEPGACYPVKDFCVEFEVHGEPKSLVGIAASIHYHLKDPRTPGQVSFNNPDEKCWRSDLYCIFVDDADGPRTYFRKQIKRWRYINTNLDQFYIHL